MRFTLLIMVGAAFGLIACITKLAGHRSFCVKCLLAKPGLASLLAAHTANIYCMELLYRLAPCGPVSNDGGIAELSERGGLSARGAGKN